jgi:aspartyl-tRNA(Asn)/glutamyl-tRNA(Gln) amidotransferase subunit C
MELTPEQLHHIAELARLSLNPDEEKALAADISQILDYMEMLSGLDLPDLPPRPGIRSDAWRDDCPEPSLDRADVLANAPQTESDQIVVPPVLPGTEEQA